jgi:hypothetical protein
VSATLTSRGSVPVKNWFSHETRKRQMKRALAMREKGMSVAAISAALGVNRQAQSERFRLHDRRMAMAKDAPETNLDPGPVWSKARRIGAARRLKKKWCLDLIAEDLNNLPGPLVSPRDVLAYARGEVA